MKERYLKGIRCLLGHYNFFYGTSFLVILIITAIPFVSFFRFSDPYTMMKWITLLFAVSLMLIIFFYKNTSFVLPRLSRTSLYLMGCIALVWLMNSYLHNVPLFSFENTQRYMFWGLCFFFFNFFFSAKIEGFDKIVSNLSFG